jgi:hypothetical protein
MENLRSVFDGTEENYEKKSPIKLYENPTLFFINHQSQ